ncbi:GNAT family N-acetyltransferase [Candidatus Roizmanbacteria bacterium]|nr:GNAT family N-acetyltransferase [Candidatus Roizmanbacteria bacterium]
MKIRRADLNDKNQLKYLLQGFYLDDKKRFSKQLQKWEKYKNDQDVIEATSTNYLNDQKYIVYVAEKDNNLIGYIVGEVKDKPHKVYDKEGYVQDWFVQEEYREQNIGKLLFDILIKEFKRLNCTHIALDSFVENKRAIDIYHKMGFKNRLLVLRKEM